MRKIIILFALLALSLGSFSCGGGGAGGPDVPPGENPGIPSLVQLLPVHYIAQTNSYIYLKAKVLDGNGVPVKNVTVYFTNLSSIGVLSPPVANTDAYGIATVTLFSGTPGFAIIQAEVNTGAGNVRDRKSVFFTTAIVIYPTLSLSIDNDGDGVYNESGDFILIANGRDRATLKATLLDATGTPLVGRTISFSTDTTYIDCTIEDCTSLKQPFKQEIMFPNGRSGWTNALGEATIEIVASSNLKEFMTSFNVAAYDITSGASDLFTVFLDPVTIGFISITANPPVLEPSKLGTASTSEIKACAYSTAPDPFNVGVPAPDGTIIQFTSTGGTILPPFAQTTGGTGCATATFTAPATSGNFTITASVGSESASIVVIVTTELTIIPDSFDIGCTAPGTFGPVPIQYFVAGGVAPYTVYFTLPQFVDASSPTQNGDTVGTAGKNQATFEVRYAGTCGEAKFQLVLVDSASGQVTSEVTITPAGP